VSAQSVGPRAWLADTRAHIADHQVHRIPELLPWNWKAAREREAKANAAA
jgi:transposase